MGLFFNEEFLVDLDTKEWPLLKVGTVLPRNKKQISEGLKFLSNQSIRNRFGGSKREFSNEELHYLTELDGINHYAIGIEETLTPHRGVGIVRMVRSSEDQEEAEIALILIDEYQGKGLGNLLMDLMTLAAWERGIRKFSFTFLPHNKAIQGLIKKLGTPRPGMVTGDSIQYFIDLTIDDVKRVKARLLQHLPAIDTFRSET